MAAKRSRHDVGNDRLTRDAIIQNYSEILPTQMSLNITQSPIRL
jgi:hypothetical protein